MLPNLSECRAAAPTTVTAEQSIREGKDTAEIVGIMERHTKAQIDVLAVALEKSNTQMLQMQSTLMTAISNLEIQVTALQTRVSQLETPLAAPPRQW